MTNPPDVSLDDFTAAKEIFEKLQDLPSDRQQRVLRWVAEGLGLMPVVGVQGPAVPPSAVSPVPPATADVQDPLRRSGAVHIDIKSFVHQKAPSSDMQFAAVVAYWYRFEAPPAQRRDTITPEVLIEAARLASRKRTPSPSKTLNNAKKQGYLDSPSRGEFCINSVGENLVAMTLGDGGAPPPRQRKKRTSAKKTKGSKKVRAKKTKGSKKASGKKTKGSRKASSKKSKAR